MSQETAPRSDEVPPPMVLFQMMSGYWVSQMIYVAAKLGLADRLQDGPKTSDELAAATGTHAPTLYRLMRGLASVGVFVQEDGARFSSTPLSALLQEGPHSVRAMALHLGEAPSWQAWGDLLHSVQTGEAGFAHVHGMEVFPYYARHAESNRFFNEAMTNYSAVVIEAILQAYDFSGAGKVVDVGGGHGSLLAAILQANPSCTGVLFDVPPAVEDARKRIVSQGLAQRCELVGGDFFESVPPGGDTYILKTIIHDWDDQRAGTILENIRRAMNPRGRVLIAETVITPDNEPFFGKLSDLHMLIMTGGRERTAAEYAKLFDAAGLELTRVVPTQSLMSIVEAVKTR